VRLGLAVGHVRYRPRHPHRDPIEGTTSMSNIDDDPTTADDGDAAHADPDYDEPGDAPLADLDDDD
jgi:hypothetical protein